MRDRLALWGAHIQLQAWAHRLTPGTAKQPAASALQAAADFRLDHDPFLTFAERAGFRLHPLIDFVGTDFGGDPHFFMGKTTEYYWRVPRLFGFRNNFNAYFDPGDFTYIVMTGNSELVGISHETSIAQNLEKILNERTGRNYRVLNLAMNSATTAQEINFFRQPGVRSSPRVRHQPLIFHGYRLRISGAHRSFSRWGLFYLPTAKDSTERIHAGNHDPRAFVLADEAVSEKHLLEGCIRNLQRYRDIAMASGAHFIMGIQKFDASRVKDLPGPTGASAYDRVALACTRNSRISLPIASWTSM